LSDILWTWLGLGLNDKYLNPRYFAPVENFRVRYFVLPFDVAQAAHMELIKTVYVAPIGGPRLASVQAQQSGNDNSLVDCDFCTWAYTTFIPVTRF